MTEKKYIDIEGMQARVDEENKKKSEQFRSHLTDMTKRNEQQQKKLSALFTKAAQSSREEAEKHRAVEIEAEKEKAAQAIEAKYEEQGVKSEQTKQTDEALKNMLRNMTGAND